MRSSRRRASITVDPLVAKIVRNIDEKSPLVPFRDHVQHLLQRVALGGVWNVKLRGQHAHENCSAAGASRGSS